jgi:tRNA A37 methylthiotransferase MiaB
VSGVDVITFGCRLNTYESEVIKVEAGKAGLDNALVFNTCAVTSEAVRQARQAIRRARRENPESRIIVTGCAAQTEGADFAGMPEVDLVLGNEEKLKAASYRSLPDFGVGASEKLRVNDIMSVTRDGAADGRADRRACPRLHPGPERLRPSLHLLHHPLWPRQFALRADGIGGRAGADAGG